MLSKILLPFALLLPERVKAAVDSLNSFDVSQWGYQVTWEGFLGNAFNTATITIEYVAVAVFVLGALFFTIALGSEERKTKGKNMMIWSLVGLAIVFGAQAILKTVSYFLWG